MLSMVKNMQRGFTLIELMITVAIIAILASVAYPGYIKQVQKSRRADAKVALSEAAQRQERYFMANRSYASSLGSAAGGLNYTTTSPEGQYSLSVSVTPAGCNGTSANACSAFTVTAAPATGKAQVTDNPCKSMSIDHRGVKSAKDNANNASTVCW